MLKHVYLFNKMLEINIIIIIIIILSMLRAFMLNIFE